jgi:hypothetical protein
MSESYLSNLSINAVSVLIDKPHMFCELINVWVTILGVEDA